MFARRQLPFVPIKLLTHYVGYFYESYNFILVYLCKSVLNYLCWYTLNHGFLISLIAFVRQCSARFIELHGRRTAWYAVIHGVILPCAPVVFRSAQMDVSKQRTSYRSGLRATANRLSCSGLTNDHSTMRATRYKHETEINFRHVQRRRLERFFGLRIVCFKRL